MRFEDITHEIIGAAMEVHRTLGNGFQERIYQRALAIELDERGLQFEREMNMKIMYKNHNVGRRRVDFFVENQIMVEIKAVIQLEDVHLAQAMNYCQAYHLPVGLLINFGSKSLQFKRVYNLTHPDNKQYKKDRYNNQLSEPEETYFIEENHSTPQNPSNLKPQNPNTER